MQSIVISLKDAKERREHITKEFSNKNINFDFFDALTPDLAEPLSEIMQLKVNAEFLTRGELACFMSHVSIWKKMVDNKIPYLAVFEDDVFLGEQANLFLNSSDWIQSHWNIIKLEAFAEKVFLGSNSTILASSDRQVFELKGKNLGTAGYILSLQGAQSYLDFIQKNQLIALDQMMFDTFISAKTTAVYQMVPALCIQEMMLYPEKKTMLSSDLLAERKARMKQFKKKGWAKIKLELIRILKQIKYALIAKKVGFK